MPVKFQPDKLMHYIATGVITFIGCMTMGPIVGVGAGVGAGVGKELYDKQNGKEISRGDLYADGAGVVVAFITYALIWMVQQG